MRIWTHFLGENENHPEKNVLGKRRTLARKGEIIGKQGSLYKVKTNLGEELIPRYKIAFID